jgi:hypothetical protein
MGVYLCLGQEIYHLTHKNALHVNKFANFKAIHNYLLENKKVFIYMGEGQHKIKRKAEQIACNEALKIIEEFIE